MSYSLGSKFCIFRTNNKNELLQKKISVQKNSCKICNNNIDIIKCTKCSFYFCKQCLKKKFNIFNINQQFICKFCIDNGKKNISITKFFKVEQNAPGNNTMKKNTKKNLFKNEVIEINNMKNISLSEEDEKYFFNEKDKANLPLKYQLDSKDFNHKNPNENHKNGNISQENLENKLFKNEKNSHNNLFLKSFNSHQNNTSPSPNVFFQNISQNIYSNSKINSQNIFNISNNNNIISFPFQNLNENKLKDININKVSNLNDIINKTPNQLKNENFAQNSNSSIKNSNEEDKDYKNNLRYKLKTIFTYLYNYDKNNLHSNFEILEKMESLISLFGELVIKIIQIIQIPNINIDSNINKDNDLKNINFIRLMNETLKNQLKNLKTYLDIEKIFISIIYQNLNQFLKDLEKIGNNDNNIQKSIKEIERQKNNNNSNDNKIKKIFEIREFLCQDN